MKTPELVRRFLPKSKFARSVSILVGGTAMGQAITVLASPLLTRLYTAEDFGVLAVYSSILSIVSIVASLRYELAIPLSKEDGDVANLLALSLGLVLFMGILAGIGTLLFGAQIIRWANVTTLQPYLWLLPLGIVIVGTYNVLNYWAIRKQAFHQIARTKLSQGVGGVITQIGLGILKLGPLGLLFGQIIGRSAGTISLAMLTYKKDTNALKAIKTAKVRDVAVRYKKFPLFSSGAALINSLGLQIPTILISAFYGADVVGQFALVQRVLGMPLTLIGTSVSQVYFGRVAQEAQTNIQGLQRLFFSLAKHLAILGSIPTIILVTTGPFLFTFVFGDQWRQAGIYAQFMACMFLSQFITVPLSYTFSALERQDLSLIWNISRVLLSVGSLYIAFRLGWSPTHAIITYSLGMLAGYLSLFALSAYAIRSRIN